VNVLLESYTWSPELIGRALALAIYLCKRELTEDLYRLDLIVDEEASIYVGGPRYNKEGYLEDDFQTFTSLQAAVLRQDISLVQRLIELKGANVNHPAMGVGGRTALQYAVERGNKELVKILLDHGVLVNAAPASCGGATALQLAAIKGYQGLARHMIDLYAKVLCRGECTRCRGTW
jgi:ankyrin repeat protein